jgi:hypothetical protein
MIDNKNSRPKIDTKLNLSYGIKCRFFVLIWSFYHISFGHFLVKVTLNVCNDSTDQTQWSKLGKMLAICNTSNALIYL